METHVKGYHKTFTHINAHCSALTLSNSSFCFPIIVVHRTTFVVLFFHLFKNIDSEVMQGEAIAMRLPRILLV